MYTCMFGRTCCMYGYACIYGYAWLCMYLLLRGLYVCVYVMYTHMIGMRTESYNVIFTCMCRCVTHFQISVITCFVIACIVTMCHQHYSYAYVGFQQHIGACIWLWSSWFLNVDIYIRILYSLVHTRRTNGYVFVTLHTYLLALALCNQVWI